MFICVCLHHDYSIMSALKGYLILNRKRIIKANFACCVEWDWLLYIRFNCSTTGRTYKVMLSQWCFLDSSFKKIFALFCFWFWGVWFPGEKPSNLTIDRLCFNNAISAKPSLIRFHFRYFFSDTGIYSNLFPSCSSKYTNQEIVQIIIL